MMERLVDHLIHKLYHTFITAASRANMQLLWNPDFTNLQGKRKLVRLKNQRVLVIGGKLQCSTEERKRLLFLGIGKLKKLRIREIGIPLYKQHYWEGGTSSIIIRDTEFHPVKASPSNSP